jgi:hypothetical protein
VVNKITNLVDLKLTAIWIRTEKKPTAAIRDKLYTTRYVMVAIVYGSALSTLKNDCQMLHALHRRNHPHIMAAIDT